MNPEERQMLQETLRLSQENNHLLHKVRRSAAISNIMQLVYWALILGLPVVLYFYFLQPYVEQTLQYYKNIQGGAEQAQGAVEQLKNSGIGDILKNLGI